MTKTELTQGTIDFGKGPTHYETRAMYDQHGFDQARSKHAPQYHNANQQIDVITAEVKDKNHKNFGFDRYTAAN